MSSLETISLKEESVSSLGDGRMGGSNPQTAWMKSDADGPQVASPIMSPGPLSGGPPSTGAWSEDGEAMRTKIDELTEKLAEQKLEYESEIFRLKHQLAAAHGPEADSADKELRDELERVKGDLEMANEKIEEYEQELMFNTMMESNGSLPSNPSSIERDSSREELQQLQEKLDQKEQELLRTQLELKQSREKLHERKHSQDAKGVVGSGLEKELREAREAAKTSQKELQEANERLVLQDDELRSMKERLSVKQKELEEVEGMWSQLQSDVESTSQELKDTKATLSSKQRELDEAEKNLRAAQMQLDAAKKDGNDKPTPQKLGDKRLATKLNSAMADAQKFKKEAEDLQQKYQEVTDQQKKVVAEKTALVSDLTASLHVKDGEISDMREKYSKLEQEAIAQKIELESTLHRNRKEFEYERREQSATISQLKEDKEKKLQEIDTLEQDNVDYQQQISTLRRQSEERDRRLSEVEMSLHQVQREKALAAEEAQSAKEKLRKATEKIKVVEEDRSELQTRIFALTQEKNNLATEKQGVEEVCGEFKDEAEKTMADYNKLADEFKDACKDRDEFRTQRQNALRTLAKRDADLGEKNKELETKNEELIAKGRKVKELANELAAMREQLKVYDEGFMVERKAREKAVEEIKEFKHKIASLEKNKKELQDQLNRQSRSHFQHEFSDDNYSPSPVTTPRGAGGQYVPSPGLASPNFPGPGARHPH